jgi:hypothetical protein
MQHSAVLGGARPDRDAGPGVAIFPTRAALLNWAFPSYGFNPALAPHGDVAATASAITKVGQTDPASARSPTVPGRSAIMLGSGFRRDAQQQSNRGSVIAGTTFMC